jgi:osmotically-inducible protein OsmY
MKRKYLFPLIALLLLVPVACSSLNQVTPDEWDDAAIEAEIRKNMAEDVDMKVFDIGVKVEDGRVTLDGTVDTADQRTKAGDAARDVKGVKSVINNISVR